MILLHWCVVLDPAFISFSEGSRPCLSVLEKGQLFSLIHVLHQFFNVLDVSVVEISQVSFSHWTFKSFVNQAVNGLVNIKNRKRLLVLKNGPIYLVFLLFILFKTFVDALGDAFEDQKLAFFLFLILHGHLQLLLFFCCITYRNYTK